MWKFVAASVVGTSHVAQGKGCDDASMVSVVGHPDGDYLVAACCDGAGSASQSSVGAKVVAQRFIEIATAHVLEKGLESEVPRETVVDWCEQIRERLRAVAEETDVPIREFACTLLGAIIGPSAALFLQVGDGAMVIRKSEDYEVVFWPQSGEYVNTTNFLTQDDFEPALATRYQRAKVLEFAAFTDGLERLALKFAEQLPHRPFFESLLGPIRVSDAKFSFEEPLRNYLASDKVNARTDDDKSLILAVRIDDANSELGR